MIQSVDDEKVKCRLVEPMFDPREGIVYESGEEFSILVNPPVMHEFCAYDHGWAMVKIYAGHGERRDGPSTGNVVVTMTYVTGQGGLVPIRLSDVPVLVEMVERCKLFWHGDDGELKIENSQETKGRIVKTKHRSFKLVAYNRQCNLLDKKNPGLGGKKEKVDDATKRKGTSDTVRAYETCKSKEKVVDEKEELQV